jgi:flagellar hook-basal body complex protein FliE
MSTEAINNILSQIRAHSLRQDEPNAASSKGEFAELLAASIEQVAKAQQEADEMKAAFEAGMEDMELPEVMIASQKASLAFETTVEVRNRLLAAYQEIMSMQV